MFCTRTMVILLDSKFISIINGNTCHILGIYCFFLSSFTESINFDHHLRCGGWLTFEFSKRETQSGWAIKTFYKKLNRGMLKHINLYQ